MLLCLEKQTNMNSNLYHFELLPFLLSPILFYTIYFLSRRSVEVEQIKKLIRFTALTSLLTIPWGIYLLSNSTFLTSNLVTIQAIGFSIRIDALNLILLGMIAIISSIVLTYSFNYLNGEQKQGYFLGNMSATIAAVQLFVLSENLFLLFLTWVLTSLHLNKLLRYYDDRRRARVAARKKFILARIGDITMISAFTLLYMEFGSANLTVLFKTAQQLESANLNLELAMLLLAVTAILKSAQFPFHGWLVEVMEAPTPVSALLHAGLINAGPFLMIRFSTLLSLGQLTSTILFVIGGLSALYGALVYSSQTSVKTALAYSSVAHMGFSMMICGLGIYSAALLHLTAHSFYKAHAFLSSGSVVDSARIYNLQTNFRTLKPMKLVLGIGASLICFSAVFFFPSLTNGLRFEYLFLASIIFLALMVLLASTFDSVSSLRSMVNAALLGVVLMVSFFSLEYAISELISAQLPTRVVENSGIHIAAYAFLSLFILTAILYLIAPFFQTNLVYKKVATHLRNGLYLNHHFDKLIGAHKVKKAF